MVGHMNKPKVESFLSVLNRAGAFLGARVHSVDACLDAAVAGLASGKGASKCVELAAKVASLAPDEVEQWVCRVINDLAAACEAPEKWFESGRAALFLFAANLASGTVNEAKLRMISDFALSKFVPGSEEQLADHLRIAALFLQKLNCDRSVFPSGPVSLLRRVLVDRQSLGFFVPQKLTAAAVKLFNEAAKFPTVKEILPELCSEFPNQPLFRGIRASAEEAGLQRIEAYLNRRVFPPMIHMIQPQLEFVPKFRTEEDMLRDKLKRARREAKRTERQVAKVKMQEMREAHRKRKEERDKTWKENIAMLEAGRTDDLNMAAAPAQDDEEESSFNEEESE